MLPVYKTDNRKYINQDLSRYLTPTEDTEVSFKDRFPEESSIQPAPQQMVARNLAGGKDLFHASELTGFEPQDGYPLLLPDWIERDGLKCLKMKLNGTDPDRNYNRPRARWIYQPLGVPYSDIEWMRYSERFRLRFINLEKMR